ncbi:hypothetical protein [Chamaesiphon sp.]|uniref:hypothetical protein n=1 Tax=Chamaesiphon sp. TaxID=2814140 RepID=UPI00359480C3
MTSPQPQDWKSRFQDLKIEIERATSGSPGSESLNQIEVDAPVGMDALGRGYQQFLSWFQGIPASGKLLAIAGGGLLSLTLIKTVFQLIASLITLAVFGVILYLVYRFWILPKSSEE